MCRLRKWPGPTVQDVEAQDRDGREQGPGRDSEESLDVQTEDEDAFLETQEAFYASSRPSAASNDGSAAEPLLSKQESGL